MSEVKVSDQAIARARRMIEGVRRQTECNAHQTGPGAIDALEDVFELLVTEVEQLREREAKALGVLEAFFNWTGDGWHGDQLDLEITRGFIGKVEKALKGK